MLLKLETKHLQEQFATSCLTGINVLIPGVKNEALVVYQRLVQNVIKDTLLQAFPIAVQSLDPKDWNSIVDQFIHNHPCESWAIWKMPYEFYQFVLSNCEYDHKNYFFLNDLLLFEWLEIELFTMEDKDLPAYSTQGDFCSDRIILNPEHELVCLRYPVHKKRYPDFNDQQGNYYLLGFRNMGTKEVSFIDISILYAWMIERLSIEAKSLDQLVTEACQLFSISDRTSLQQHATDFFKDLKNQGAILGFQITN
jgi:hypothetical protein